MTFPALKSGVVAQYPLDLKVEWDTESVNFLDGSRQRFKRRGVGLRRWLINLSLLDEQEGASWRAFFEALRDNEFAFPDPISGTTVNCRVFGSVFSNVMDGELAAGCYVVFEAIG